MAMANITFSFTATSSTTCPTMPTNLQVHARANIPDEIWTVRTNASARRKLQNRLSQRTLRRRKATEKAEKVQVFDINPGILPAPSEAAINSQGNLTQVKDGFSAPKMDSASTKLNSSHLPYRRLPNAYLHPPESTASWCKAMESFLNTHQVVDVQDDVSKVPAGSSVVSFEESFLKNLGPADFYRFPADDHLLSLMYYNVFRALASNAQLLGLNTYEMHADDYPSPFVTSSAYSRRIPPHLQPTILQQTVPHHPCFDIFPDPVVRDKGIENTHLLPHGMLCMTLAGRNTWFENERSRRSGLIIWGPPEDANSWEVTEGFVANWIWLVKDSLMLQYSTNRWRAVRGEPAIFFA